MTNTEIVRGGYDAFKRGDVGAVFELFEPEVEIYQSELLPWGGNYRGHQGAHEFFTTLMANVETIVDPEEVIEAGDRVVEIGVSRGRVKVSDTEFAVREVHVWQLRHGKVVRFEAYLDTPQCSDYLSTRPQRGDPCHASVHTPARPGSHTSSHRFGRRVPSPRRGRLRTRGPARPSASAVTRNSEAFPEIRADGCRAA